MRIQPRMKGLTLFLAVVLCLCQPASAGETVHLQIIVVPTREAAESVLAALKAGADFSEVAKRVSTDSSGDSGGYLGNIDPNDLRTDLRNAIKKTSPGEMSDVIQLPSGFAIVKVLKEKPAERAPAQSTGNQPAGPGYLQATNPNQSLTGPGNVKITPNIGGGPEAETAFFAAIKEPGFDHDLQALCRYRTESLARNIDYLSDMLRPGNEEAKSVSKIDIALMHYALAQLQAYRGDIVPSVAEFEATNEFAKVNFPAYVGMTGEALAATELHASEMQSGVYTSPDDRCLVPQVGQVAPLREPALADKSVARFLQLLEVKPDDLELRWLLNLAYIEEGKYPAAVPAKYLIPPSYFGGEGGIGRFRDIAPQLGLTLVSMAGGVIVDDFDGDGLLDIVTSSMNFCEHMHFFHNNGDGTFADRSKEAGLLDQLGGLNSTQADYDNDGCTDVLVMRGGWEFPMRRSLLKNDCKGHFTDVTQAAGLMDPIAESQTAVWTDLDNDGYLDLFVGNEKGPSQLFHNKGNGTFEEIAQRAGITGQSYTKSVAAGDYDNDGFPDLYVSNLYADNFLYHNNGNLTFTQVESQAGVQKPSASFASWFFDYDNDGWPDIFVTSYYMSIDEVARSRMRLPVNAETMKLFRNLGNGKFEDVTAKAGLDKVFMPMGGNFGDIDNDGYLDIYVGSGNPSFTSLTPYALYRNDRGVKFQDVTAATGTGELHKGHGVAFADLGNNGQEEIITIVGGAVPSDSHRMRVFANPGNANDWITLHLIGVKTNRGAMGARIKVTLDSDGQKGRAIYRTVGTGGSFGASPLRQHIGLGKSAKNATVEIDWPTSKTKQVFRNVPVDKFLEIREFDQSYKVMSLKSFALAGAQ